MADDYEQALHDHFDKYQSLMQQLTGLKIRIQFAENSFRIMIGSESYSAAKADLAPDIFKRCQQLWIDNLKDEQEKVLKQISEFLSERGPTD